MRELSLHLLDLLENSIRAGAHHVHVAVREDRPGNRLELSVEDDGRGLRVTAEQALDPFYTTKNGKRTGLGLPLLQSTAEQAGGHLALRRSDAGGLLVHAVMELENVDRAPLGDLAATVSMLACTNPEVEFSCELRVGSESVRISSEQARATLGDDDPIAVSLELAEGIRQGQQALGMKS